MSGTTVAAELAALIPLVRRLAPDRRDPERFHVEKGEVVAALHRAVRRLEAETATPRVRAVYSDQGRTTRAARSA